MNEIRNDASHDDDLQFADEGQEAAPTPPWTVLVVDDEPDVHAVTRLALQSARFENRGVRLLHAHSAAAARDLLAAENEIALILLDVVMETDDAGLKLVSHVRETLGNRDMRIVLRTGQPGVAPARSVIDHYEIDDYRAKTELTLERLHVSVASALRTFGLLQAQRRRERALLESHQELERFAYVASHDLQTPLRAIVGYTQLLQRRHAAAMDDDGRGLLRDVVDAGLHLSALIRELLEFSELGATPPPLEDVDLAVILPRVQKRLAATIDARGVVLQTDVLPVVRGHAMMLEQGLVALVDNAIKFTPGSSPKVRLRVLDTPQGIDIEVIDRGIGIEPQHLPLVLEGFNRLHTQDAYPGSGLGLAISKKIARLHGGELVAHSVPTIGSTFVLRLPKDSSLNR